jgi:hypothetical protein
MKIVRFNYRPCHQPNGKGEIDSSCRATGELRIGFKLKNKSSEYEHHTMITLSAQAVFLITDCVRARIL